MGRKNVLYSKVMLETAAITGARYSEIVPVANLDKASIVLTSTLTGTCSISVEARNGVDKPWYTLAVGPVLVGPSEPVNQIVFNELPFTDIRLNQAAGTGTGTVNAILTAKVVGA